MSPLFSKPIKQPEGLIGVLLDPTAREDERDDAASNLADFSDPIAEAALIKVGSDPNTDSGLADTCGESLGEMWAREGRIDRKALDKLVPVARIIATATIRANRPDLLLDD